MDLVVLGGTIWEETKKRKWVTKTHNMLRFLYGHKTTNKQPNRKQMIKGAQGMIEFSSAMLIKMEPKGE